MEQTISATVEKWIEEEQASRPVLLRVIRINDPWYGMSEDEIEDRREYIRWYLNKDFELLLLIPLHPRETDFWFSSYQEFLESPFNTHDFQDRRKPFDKYGYRIKKVMERVKDLAIMYSCLTTPEGRSIVQARFENLVDREFREELLNVVERYHRTLEIRTQLELRLKISKLNRQILECKAVWQKYSTWA